MEREIRLVEDLIEDLEQVQLRLMHISQDLEWHSINQATKQAEEHYQKYLVHLMDLRI
ncbi:hypothetical protein [Spirosoma validum]|uniref:Uncharacterized protein n=1 Tax=Spirosoma validum TaxID=2771355 RepID=A0A927GER7_9BACT|nr:hypothetical protein [Spirosoma validum]MBD2755079.1 hypothetical protein [Spirosoma validum]